MRVEFTISIGAAAGLPGIEYELSADVADGNVLLSELTCESYTVYHDGSGDQVYPEDSDRIVRVLLAKHAAYITREALKSARLEVAHAD